MLRFNEREVRTSFQEGRISIHPMLRFNSISCYFWNLWRKFQYILCYGSTFCLTQQTPKAIHFNTSYVTVQPLSYNFHRLWQSNFNTSYVTVQRPITIIPIPIPASFQYILCYGSTTIFTTECLNINHFNTSYVTVQRSCWC